MTTKLRLTPSQSNTIASALAAPHTKQMRREEIHGGVDETADGVDSINERKLDSKIKSRIATPMKQVKKSLKQTKASGDDNTKIVNATNESSEKKVDADKSSTPPVDDDPVESPKQPIHATRSSPRIASSSTGSGATSPALSDPTKKTSSVGRKRKSKQVPLEIVHTRASPRKSTQLATLSSDHLAAQGGVSGVAEEADEENGASPKKKAKGTTKKSPVTTNAKTSEKVTPVE